MSDKSVPVTLGYSSLSRPWWTRRWIRRVGIVVILLGIGVSLAWPTVAPYVAQARVVWKQRKHFNDFLSPEKIVYSDDPTKTSALQSRSGYMRSDYGLGTSYRPEANDSSWPLAIRYVDDLAAPNTLSGDARGLRVAPTGEQWIIGTGTSNFASSESKRVLIITQSSEALTSWTPGSSLTGVSFNGMPILLKKEDRFTLYAGQPDPSDKSKFSYVYELNGQSGVIDAQVQKNGYIKMKIRSGPAHEAPPRWWQSPPTTVPAPTAIP